MFDNCECWALTCLNASRLVKLFYLHLISCWRKRQYATQTAQLLLSHQGVDYHFLKDIFRSQATHWWNVAPNYISTFRHNLYFYLRQI